MLQSTGLNAASEMKDKKSGSQQVEKLFIFENIVMLSSNVFRVIGRLKRVDI